jgi:hypothetical protein
VSAALQAKLDTLLKANGADSLLDLSVAQLQAAHEVVIGRATRSKGAAFLRSRIKGAVAGEVRVGPPRKDRVRDDAKYVTLPMPADVASGLDRVISDLGFPNRLVFTEAALAYVLDRAGHAALAADFGDPERMPTAIITARKLDKA